MGIGFRDVVVGRWRCVAAEGAVVGLDGRGHTEPGVGVVVPRPEPTAGEFAQRVDCLGCLLAAPEDGDVAAAVTERLDKPVGDDADGGVPVRRLEFAAATNQWLCETVAAGVDGLLDPALAVGPLVCGVFGVSPRFGDAMAILAAALEVAAPDGTPHAGGRCRLTHQRSPAGRRLFEEKSGVDL
jgi:hypothetical protein